MIRDIKTVILPLDKDGNPNPIESKLVNKYLSTLRNENYFSSSHTIISGSKPEVIVDADGKIYVRPYCKFESLIMIQLPINPE